MEIELKQALNSLRDTLGNEFKGDMTAMQGHLDALDIKLQKAVRGGGGRIGEVDHIEKAITDNFAKIKDVSQSSGFKLKVAGTMTLGSSLTGNQPRTYAPNVSANPSEPINFADLVPHLNIGNGSYTFPLETSTDTAFGVPVEGTEKSQLEYTFEMKTVDTDFLAGFVRYSKKMQNNLPFLQAFLPSALRRDYFRAENALFYGELKSVATASTLTSGNIVERIVNEQTTLLGIGYFPNLIMVTPKDYGAILLTAGTSGSGAYSLPAVVTIQNGVLNLNGLQVIPCNFVGEDEYIIGEFARAQKIVTDGLKVEFFEPEPEKNLLLARCESQTALAILRVDAFIQGSFTTVV